MLNWIVLTLAMASTDGEVVTYVHTDALGSPVAITDSNGKVIERFTYEPYGSVVGIAAADGPGYSGHVFDSTTGLNYMQQRYYSPEIGAFLSVDPVAAYGGRSSLFNRYRYANSSPYNFVDPDGRVPVVTRMKDGSVKISFPTKFSGDGATPKNIATFKEQVASMSGTYDIGGKETRVTVEVTDIERSTPRAARNEIKLVSGETSHRSGRSFAELGGKKGEINVLDRFDKGVVPHEVSHLGGVDDLYDKTTGLPNPARGDGIMNRVPGVVDSHAIGGIVDGDSAVQRRER
ncbi:RHS repeat-associated core domain-containing protein [Stenotrophomonas sp. EMP41]|uniref:RHS repeat-associated core domain-containing protein n=1 Tax=Stenotrophomonas sp. EMP41 TaxID=3396625 RepID=UPI0039C20CA8